MAVPAVCVLAVVPSAARTMIHGLATVPAPELTETSSSLLVPGSSRRIHGNWVG